MFVLGSAMLVTVIGLSALTVVRVQRRAAEGTNDLSAARFYAQSAIEVGFFLMASDADWLNTRGDGPWLTNEVIGGGTMSLDVTLNNDDAILTGTGASGETVHVLEVRLVPSNGVMAIAPGSWRRVVEP